MRINRKLLKKRSRRVNNTVYKFSHKGYLQFDKIELLPFSIIITFSSDRIPSLRDCLYYLNRCKGIEICEIMLVLYQNEYVEYNFSQYKNINYKIIHSKRNNPENKFCLSHARNIGMVNASNDWVLMLDADIMIPPDLCRVLSHPKIRMENYIYATSRVNISSHRNYTLLDVLYHEKLSIDDSFIGFFHFFNRHRIMNSVGGYDEEMYAWGREDCDLVTRAQISGMNVKPIKFYIFAYHIPHGYADDWKYNGSDERNHQLQDYNLNNNLIKKENIGIIIT